MRAQVGRARRVLPDWGSTALLVLSAAALTAVVLFVGLVLEAAVMLVVVAVPWWGQIVAICAVAGVLSRMVRSAPAVWAGCRGMCGAYVRRVKSLSSPLRRSLPARRPRTGRRGRGVSARVTDGLSG